MYKLTTRGLRSFYHVMQIPHHVPNSEIWTLDGAGSCKEEIIRCGAAAPEKTNSVTKKTAAKRPGWPNPKEIKALTKATSGMKLPSLLTIDTEELFYRKRSQAAAKGAEENITGSDSLDSQGMTLPSQAQSLVIVDITSEAPKRHQKADFIASGEYR
ncbi:uncharacterized protein BDR25DRAFT_310024 [Lindgomyces ingoldianus]|uniref:Uncharacterized protein n=1 Tax=Lindgomyces ingoldianus TaxID=673940 RepID=A0ACB6REC6_9PLEO|nr:uncharacterized protein BDR25DRAFT_310024 [Lindgomyces ingoldianus]KAF2476677.1 hypothetical protein BDR25DRAFT_310024 [Lindgomyces ingoldianus]